MPGTILAVGAHMDDCENGAGGVILDAVQRGWRVVVVTVVSDFSTWAPTVGREDQVRQELLDLADRFGYEKRFLDYAYHQVEPNIQLKRRIAAIYDEVSPQIGLVHCPEDHWPDHRATGIAAKDAMIFAHGLSGNLQAPRCERIFGYSSTPHQMVSFEPDFYHDVTAVMEDWMRLVTGTDCCLSGMAADELPLHTVTVPASGDRPERTLRCSHHGWLKLAECVVWGNRGARCPFALGLKALWGPREGRPLFDD